MSSEFVTHTKISGFEYNFRICTEAGLQIHSLDVNFEFTPYLRRKFRVQKPGASAVLSEVSFRVTVYIEYDNNIIHPGYLA